MVRSRARRFSGRYVITPEQVRSPAAVDENTSSAVAILGTTYTGELEPIAEICAALDKLAAGGVDAGTRRRGQWGLQPLHPDPV